MFRKQLAEKLGWKNWGRINKPWALISNPGPEMGREENKVICNNLQSVSLEYPNCDYLRGYR